MKKEDNTGETIEVNEKCDVESSSENVIRSDEQVEIGIPGKEEVHVQESISIEKK